MQIWKLGNYQYLFYGSMLKDWISNLQGSILDAGCGTGSLQLSGNVGIDICKRNIQVFTRVGGEGVLASVTHLPFKDDAFENAITVDVLEHVENKKLAIAELGRVVKGDLIGSTTNLLNPYMMLDVLLPKAVISKLIPIIGQGQYKRHLRLTTSQLTKALATAGFTTELTCLSFPPFQPWLYKDGKNKLPWYAYTWIVTNKLISTIKITRDTLLFKATK